MKPQPSKTPLLDEFPQIKFSSEQAELPGQVFKSNSKGYLPLPTTLQGVVFIHPEEIAFAQADEKYTLIMLLSGEKVFVSLSLKEVESLLPESDFIRPHQSYLIRIDAVRKIQKELGGVCILLKDKTEIPVSRRNKDAVFRALGVGV